MTETTNRCVAVTQSGTTCQNFTAVGSDYCPRHAHLASSRDDAASTLDDSLTADAVESSQATNKQGAADTSPAGDMSAVDDAPQAGETQSVPLSPEMEMLGHELDGLIRELRAYRPALQLENLTPAQFVHLFNRSVGKRLPSAQAELFEDVERNLDGTTFIDFADPDVLRGMAMLTYYSIQAQAESLKEPVIGRLQVVPGFSLLTELKNNLEGTTLEDLTDPDTWRGMWTIASYTAQLKLQEFLEEDDKYTRHN